MSLPTASKESKGLPPERSGPLRNAGTAVRWFRRGARAWITFKPGSRPYRTARNLALTSVRFVLARPFLVDKVRRVLDRFPSLRQRQPSILAALVASAARSLALDGPFSERERYVRMRLQAALEKRAD